MHEFSFWRDKKVLITGHTGFKGSWLSLWLQSLGADVVGYALEPYTDPNLFEIARVAEGMTSLVGDVCDASQVCRVVEQHRPEIVFHMAAQPLVLDGYKDPVGTYAVNVMGTVNVLEAIRKTSGVRAIVCVTSDKCYENRGWIWGYREYESMGGLDPYSSSKGCAELVAGAYRASFFNESDYSSHGVALATARAGNVIGGGDWSKYRLFSDMTVALTERRTMVLRHPEATRPWQHVLDALHGYLVLAEHLYKDGPSYSQAWNFGPEQSHTVSHVVDQLLAQWGEQTTWERDLARYQHEDNHLTLDSSKARAKLGWKPALDLSTSLKWIVEWLKSFQAGADMRRITREQIAKFTEILTSGETSKQSKTHAFQSSLNLSAIGGAADICDSGVLLKLLEQTHSYAVLSGLL
jgi:CDP-glucose 4,6-dehydratase